MNGSIMKKPSWYFDRFSSISVSKSIWMGIGVFTTYLIMNGLVLFQTFSTIKEHLPNHLSGLFAQVFPVLYISSAVGAALGEIATYFIGWLFIMIAVTLLNGKRQHRVLFGWLGIGYIPVALYSALAFTFILIYSDQMVPAGVSAISQIEQLPLEIEKMQNSGWFQLIRYGRYGAIVLVVVFAIEVVHRICVLTRYKATGALLAYVAIIGLIHVLIA